MAQAGNKKVVVERFDREQVAGFVQASEALAGGPIEVLKTDGNLVRIPRADAKAVCFVRDLEAPEAWKKHRSFQARPKLEGLWLRLRFRDGDTMEGLAGNNLLGLEAGGFTVTPPDGSFHNQRVFVPAEALTLVEVLGVIGTPQRRRPKPVPPADIGKQLEMFG